MQAPGALIRDNTVLEIPKGGFWGPLKKSSFAMFFSRVHAVFLVNLKIIHGLSSRYFPVLTSISFDETTSLCIKARIPSDDCRKQLTSCCSIPSNISVDRLYFQIEEKLKKSQVEKNYCRSYNKKFNRGGSETPSGSIKVKTGLCKSAL